MFLSVSWSLCLSLHPIPFLAFVAGKNKAVLFSVIWCIEFLCFYYEDLSSRGVICFLKLQTNKEAQLSSFLKYDIQLLFLTLCVNSLMRESAPRRIGSLGTVWFRLRGGLAAPAFNRAWERLFELLKMKMPIGLLILFLLYLLSIQGGGMRQILWDGKKCPFFYLFCV